MCSDVVIRAEGLTKSYRVFNQSADRLKQAVTFGRRQYYKRFTALDNVSFEIRKGESVGIVGRNGSGKSTLLQLVCGILRPSAGVLDTRGRISALLELGAGFHPDLTGRENAVFVGTILGMSADEMKLRLPLIEEFADIGEFIDQPVRVYSSGMFVRLAFSTAIHVEPEILVVDEALAVGDLAFQAKCLSAFNQLRSNGVTVLFVSHDLEAVKALCDRAIYLEGGTLKGEGPASAVTEQYLRDLRLGSNRPIHVQSYVGSDPQVPSEGEAGSGMFREDAEFSRRVAAFRYGSGDAQLTDVEILDGQGRPLSEIAFGQAFFVRFHMRFVRMSDVIVSCFVRDDKNLIISGSTTALEGLGAIHGEPGERKIVEFATTAMLGEGLHNILAVLSTPIIGDGKSHFVDHVENAAVFQILRRHPVRLWSKAYVPHRVSVFDA